MKIPLPLSRKGGGEDRLHPRSSREDPALVAVRLMSMVPVAFLIWRTKLLRPDL